MAVSSETVSSASASSARMRSRVASPAALSAPWSVSKGRWAEMGMDVGSVPISVRLASHPRAYKDIFIRLSGDCKAGMGGPRGSRLRGQTRQSIISATRGAGHDQGRAGRPRVQSLREAPMSDDEDDENAFGIREGETAAPLPD